MQPYNAQLNSLQVLAYAVLALGFAWVFVFWLTAQVFFVPNFKPSLLHLAIFLLIEGLSFAVRTPYPSASLALFIQLNVVLASTGLALHGIWIAWRGKPDDLDPERRRFRTLFSTITLSIFTAALAVSLWTLLTGRLSHPVLSTLFASLVLVGSLSLSLRLYQLMIGDPFVDNQSPNGLDLFAGPDEEATFDTLKVALVRRRMFCDETLTLSSLAEFVEIPEDQVSRLLCLGFGERDFGSLLNRFRIDAACSYLGDTEDSHRPFYEIAATVGYQSEATFNRAFTAQTGVSPSHYRQQKVDEAAGTLRLQLTNSDR